MAKPIKITIKGFGTDGSNAPTVDDLLLQIQDFAAILKGVDSAISGEDVHNIVWRVTNVTKNSPLAFELTPFPKNPQTNIDERAEDVIIATSNALSLVQTETERPKYADDRMLNRVEKLFNRVAKGLDETVIDFGEYRKAKSVTLTRRKARKTIEHIQEIKRPKYLPYNEIGSIEGIITRIERDGHGRSIVWLRTRLDDEDVKCIAAGNAANRIGHVEIERVWEGLRVRITGTLVYKGLGFLQEVSADNVQFFETDDKLPNIDDILDADFGNGLDSVSYLKNLRHEYE